MMNADKNWPVKQYSRWTVFFIAFFVLSVGSKALAKGSEKNVAADSVVVKTIENLNKDGHQLSVSSSSEQLPEKLSKITNSDSSNPNRIDQKINSNESKKSEVDVEFETAAVVANGKEGDRQEENEVGNIGDIGAKLSAGANEKSALGIAEPLSKNIKSETTQTLPENQIPVFANKDQSKKPVKGVGNRVLISLAVLTILFGALYLGLKKWISKSKTQNQSATSITVMTQHFLGPKKSLAIVRVAGESILIGITDNNISMIKTLALIDDEVPNSVPRNFDVDELDEQFPHEEISKGQFRLASNSFTDEHSDDFAMQGLSEIRDAVSDRLRSFKKF